MIRAVVRTELAKQLRRPRTWVALGLVVAVPLIIAIALRTNPPRQPEDGRDFFFVAGHSGLFVPVAALLATSHFLLIVVVSLFAGDAIAGEAAWGNLRYLLVRPVPRGRLLGGKLAVVAVFSIVATMLITLTALSAGGLLLGFKVPFVERLAGVSGTGDAVWRLVQATGYVAWSMSSMIAFGFMVSTMTDTVTGAVGAGVGLGVVAQILDAIPALGRLRGGLPTHHLEAWTHLFAPDGSRGDIVRGLILPVPYVAVFLGVAWWWFRRKDVLS